MKRLQHHHDVYVYKNMSNFEALAHIPIYGYGIVLDVIANLSFKIKPIVSMNPRQKVHLLYSNSKGECRPMLGIFCSQTVKI